MVLRHQEVFTVPPFQSSSKEHKDPDTSIRSVTGIGRVEKQHMSEGTPDEPCVHTQDDEGSPSRLLHSQSQDHISHESSNNYEHNSFEAIKGSGLMYFPPHLPSNPPLNALVYDASTTLPRQATLSLRDMYEDENYYSDSIRGFEPEGFDDDNRREVQQFDMSPASQPISTNHMRTAGEASSTRNSIGQPPVSTSSPVVTIRQRHSSNAVGSDHTHDPISDDSPPTPMARSPTSSVGSISAVKLTSALQGQKQLAPVLYSAIGSLEDPTTAHSFSRRYIERKVEFPSLLAPKPNSVATATKKNSPKVASDQSKGDATSGTGVKVERPSSRMKKGPPASQATVEGSTNIEQPQATPSRKPKKPSNLRRSKDVTVPTSSSSGGLPPKKSVTIAPEARPSSRGKPRKKNSPPEMFRPSSDAYTPRMGKKIIKYKDPEMRTPVASMASPLGTLQRPNFRDALRRVAMILHQHVTKIEQRFESQARQDDGLFKSSMREIFSEDQFATPTYRCTMVRVPMARPGMVYGLKRLRQKYTIPSEGEIYDFAHRLFKSVQLSSECSIVCLIYVERLMETAKVPLLADTWRPIFMCGLLLASKVWQDLSSWNIEFASVYPQYSLDSINRLELLFLRNVKWDLYISSSCYAKYYFALRSLVEKQDFRQRYNRMVGGVDSVQASEALKIEKRSSMVKEEALSQLSRSM